MSTETNEIESPKKITKTIEIIAKMSALELNANLVTREHKFLLQREDLRFSSLNGGWTHNPKRANIYTRSFVDSSTEHLCLLIKSPFENKAYTLSELEALDKSLDVFKKECVVEQIESHNPDFGKFLNRNRSGGYGAPCCVDLKGAKIDKVRNAILALEITPRTNHLGIRIVESLPFEMGCMDSDPIEPMLKSMLLSAPRNETIRSMVNAAMKKPIPDDLVEYDKIIEWSMKQSTGPKKLDEPMILQWEEFEVDPVLDIKISTHEEVIGKARWSGTFRGEGSVNVDLEELIDDNESEIRNWSDVMSLIRDRINDFANEVVPPQEHDDDDDEYEDHEVGDTTDSGWDYSDNSLHILDSVKRVIRSINPTLAESLDENT